MFVGRNKLGIATIETITKEIDAVKSSKDLQALLIAMDTH
jgi:hypothetical protein